MRKADFAANSFLGAMAVGVCLLAAPVVRLWYNRHGASKSERKKKLVGDELVSHPRLSYTRAMSIKAPAKAIWPWLLQLGQGRGGLYSYDGLENLVGCDIHSADCILPQYQHLQPGDCIDFGPADKKFPGQVVVDLEPDRYLLLCGMDPHTRKADKSATWVFVLDEQADGSTRLIVRARNGYTAGLANHLIWHLVEPVAFVMERRMLRGIKRRVEYYQRAG